jgi:hypothetical protein
MVRKFGIMVMVVIALTLAGCTTSTAKPTGIVTGVAFPCVGGVVTASRPRVTVAVTVLLYSGREVIKSETVRPDHSYRFTTAPGPYTVKLRQQAGTQSVQPYPPKAVEVRTGRTATANFPGGCF